MSASSITRGRKRFGHLEERLCHQFQDYENVERALTHASVRKKGDGNFHYERLEFLGDRVLGLVMSDLLYKHFPEAAEGELSLRFNALVKGETLAAISDELRLHEFIRTGGDLKELKSTRMQSLRADVLEAMIGSIFLDGGLGAAAEFIDRFWGTRIFDEATARRDSKTELQEWSHANRWGTPKYREMERTGPDHDPLFKVEVVVEGKDGMCGTGRSKRLAEQDAAREMLLREGVWNASEAIA